MRPGLTGWGVLTLVACLGCASSGPRYADMDADQLLAYGLERLEARKWDEAARVLEQFIFQFPTHERYQEARYRLGDAHSGKQEHLIAAAEYSRLAEDFPGGEWAEESRFKVCESYYLLSPKPQLDQEYTRSAIDHCAVVIAYYPGSELAADARLKITELENKLAQKVLDVGQHYFKRNAFDSAIVYYEKVLAGYPSSAAAPKALLGLYLAYEEIGWEEEARETRDRLLREFPGSEEARRVGSGSAMNPS